MSGQPAYSLKADGTFVIENYNQAKTFASFFPGIAGLTGVPLWAFYVNRGQAIASFGVKNKDCSIMEFHPADSAYALTPTHGFRTFIKVTNAQKTVLYEPFSVQDDDQGRISQTMRITAHDLVLEEVNAALGITVRVRYFTLPREPLAALVRVLTVENTGKAFKQIEVLDGMPKVVPHWLSEWTLKHMSYTAQAWATVSNRERKAPYFRLKVEISDCPEVSVISKGNFYFAVAESFGTSPALADVVVDPELVFGPDKGFLCPRAFSAADTFTVPDRQEGDNIFPCAMSHARATLQSGKSFTLSSVIGHAASELVVNEMAARAAKPRYFEIKALENQKCVDDVARPIHTQSANPAFDQYCRQTYLDNLLRGGTPILLPRADKEDMVFYVYSRKHGDLERDYNSFQLSPTYYSQGNGNFRDMNQNKRNDVFFAPRIRDYNVVGFYNLVQLDGYNPLLVKGTSFALTLRGAKLAALLGRLVHKEDAAALAAFLSSDFEPGSLMLFVDTHPVRLKVSPDAFLSAVLAAAESRMDADHGEGFWTDHWTYNIDLLESFSAIYPDQEDDLLFGRRAFTFYDNAHVVLPRAQKYVLHGKHVRQFGAVVKNTEKEKLLKSRARDRHVVHTRAGRGVPYQTTLAVKMFCLILNKLASLDPDGIGIEMEAEKPSWYDALNGLPGVFGSSVPETFELKRAMQYLRARLAAHRKESVRLPDEMHALYGALRALLSRRPLTPFMFWDKATAAKESYRAATLMGVSGKETAVKHSDLINFLDVAIDKVNAGLVCAIDKKSGLYYTYYMHEAARYRKTGKVSHQGIACVTVESFKTHPLPLFLEGEVHYLKTEADRDKALALHKALLKSPLYDAKLNMYKVNASLADQSHDLGRCTVFTPGWLENESIWLHMEYKYLLELLKAGLYREFFDAFHKAGVCFQKPEVYGRSILENSSFIASSAFINPANHGRGFVARLSGSTAEFIDMWLIMTCGRRPFTLTEAGALSLSFRPALPGSYFTADGLFTAAFLGVTELRYHNPRRRDTFSDGVSVSKMIVTWKDGARETINEPAITGPRAERIRRQEASVIDVFLAFQ